MPFTTVSENRLKSSRLMHNYWGSYTPWSLIRKTLRILNTEDKPERLQKLPEDTDFPSTQHRQADQELNRGHSIPAIQIRKGSSQETGKEGKRRDGGLPSSRLRVPRGGGWEAPALRVRPAGPTHLSLLKQAPPPPGRSTGLQPAAKQGKQREEERRERIAGRAEPGRAGLRPQHLPLRHDRCFQPRWRPGEAEPAQCCRLLPEMSGSTSGVRASGSADFRVG